MTNIQAKGEEMAISLRAYFRVIQEKSTVQEAHKEAVEALDRMADMHSQGISEDWFNVCARGYELILNDCTDINLIHNIAHSLEEFVEGKIQP